MTPELESLLKRIRACLMAVDNSEEDVGLEIKAVIRRRIGDIDATLAEHKPKVDQPL